jgi:hypothetical protein
VSPQQSIAHYRLGEDGPVGPDYLVMEYVAGSRLAPPGSARKLVDIAVQIADGAAQAFWAHGNFCIDGTVLARFSAIPGSTCSGICAHLLARIPNQPKH